MTCKNFFKTVFVFITVLICNNVKGQYIQNQFTIGDSTLGVESGDIQADRDGNLIVLGAYKGKIDVDPSTSTLYLSNYNLEDKGNTFIAKYSPEGNLIWAKNIVEKSEKAVNAAFKLDNNGDIILCGSAFGDTDFEEGNGSALLPIAGKILFVSKFSSDGDFLWYKTFDNIAYQLNPVIAIDDNNNILFAGKFSGAAEFDPYNNAPIGTNTKLNSYNYGEPSSINFIHLYVSKLSPNGNFIWVKQLSGADNSYDGRNLTEIQAITSDKQGNAIVIAEFNQCSHFYVDSVLELDTASCYLWQGVLYECNTDNNVLIKFSADGDYLWKKNLDIKRYLPGELTSDNYNNIFLTGHTLPQGDEFTGGLISKYSAEGDSLWRVYLDGYIWSDIRCVEVDKQNFIHIAGSYRDTITYSFNGKKESLINPMGVNNAFYFKLHNNGDFVHKSSSNYVGSSFVSGLTVTPDDSIFVAGWQKDTSDIDYGGEIYVSKISCSQSCRINNSEEIESKTNLLVYPNPCSQSLSISTIGDDLYPLTYQIIDVFGKVVDSNTINSDKDSAIKITHLRDGCYFIMANGQSNLHSKFIIKR